MASLLSKDDDILSNLLSKYPAHQLSKNRPILYQGEVPTMAFYIKKGIIKIYNITSDGEEKIVGYENKGGFLPVEWLFGRAPVSLYYYDTFTDCIVVRVPQTDVLDMLRSNHQAALMMLERSISMYISSTVHLHALEQSKARSKLLSILQYLVLRFGKPVDKNSSKIDLRLTHQEIANLIGTSRETTSVEISKLTKEKIIRTVDLRYIVDTDKALRLLGENDFNELSI